jgi:hypothetical protein
MLLDVSRGRHVLVLGGGVVAYICISAVYSLHSSSDRILLTSYAHASVVPQKRNCIEFYFSLNISVLGKAKTFFLIPHINN